MKSFRGYITENVLPSAQVADGSFDISKPVVRAAINAALAGVTSNPAVTPYVVFNRISKLLAQYHIIMPKKFLEGDKGVEVFEVRQFGLKMGMTNDGEFVKEVPAQCYLFMQYGIISPMGVTYAKPTVGGMFRVTARLVEKDELDRLLDMAEITMSEEAECRQMSAKAMAPKEPMHDVTSDEKKKGNKEAVSDSQKGLNEVSLGKLLKYRRGAEQELGDIKHYKKHPGQYPAATSDDAKSADRREKTREKGISLADKKMKGKAKVGASAPKHPYMEETLDETHADNIRRKYRQKEDDNDHTGNVHLMTRVFGSKKERETSKGLLKKRNKQGYVTGSDSKKGYEMTKDYARRMEKLKEEETVEEGRMPPSVIKHKQKLANMTPEEKAKKFAGKSEEQLKSMARRHGYGKDSNEYSKHLTKEEKGDRLTPGFGSRKDFDTIAKEIGTGQGGMTIASRGEKGADVKQSTIYPMSPKSSERVAPDDVAKKLDQSTRGNPQAERNSDLQEKAPPGAKFERMVKHIKKGYSKDGLSAKEKSIAYATAWKAKKKESKD